MERSNEFDHLLTELVDEKQVTLPIVAHKYNIGHSKVRLRDNLHM
jgi:hypothetical protein